MLTDPPLLFLDANEFCIGECVDAPEECKVKKHIMPYDGLTNQDERAVYIPKIYSDPILEILQEAAIPVEVIRPLRL